MPKEMMELIEKLKVMTKQLSWGGDIDWGIRGEDFKVFVCDKSLLPEGEPTYEYVDHIDRWYKKVDVNGIVYQTMLTDEEYEAEVA